MVPLQDEILKIKSLIIERIEDIGTMYQQRGVHFHEYFLQFLGIVIKIYVDSFLHLSVSDKDLSSCG
jgi:hypothetical protein